MRTPLLAAPVLLLALGGCCSHDDDCCYHPPRCASYTYAKDGVAEGQLLQDERVMRKAKGVEGVRTRIEGPSAVIVVYCETKNDLEVREKLVELGYHRRW